MGRPHMKLLAAVAIATSLIATGAAAQSFRPVPAVTTEMPDGDDDIYPITLPFPIRMGAEAPSDQFLISQNANLVSFVGDATPYFDDLQSRSDTGSPTYGTSTVGGRPAFIATYNDDGVCCGPTPVRMNVQFVVIDRSDIAPGDFDYEINTQGLGRTPSTSTFVVDSVDAGRAGVGSFPMGPDAYRAVWTFRSGVLTSGAGPTLIGGSPAPVPTMSEWAMILFGTVLAGGAALYLQRRRFMA